MSSNLMDTEAGGETTQYLSLRTVSKPHLKQAGQLGEKETHTDSATQQEQQETQERSEKTADNPRYEQAIPEQDVGGKTIEASMGANDDKSGSTNSPTESIQPTETRQNQGYERGSSVGG
ncbi:hypothetical protein MMC07_007350 [Pseudocyphellaria aurata]|nr:hypothetical protein [Pseudocyphellaria aurata]